MGRRENLKTLYWVLIVSGAVIIASLGGYYFLKRQMNTYSDSLGRFTIKYPKGWEVREDENGAAVVIYSPLENELDFFRENVGVVIEDHPNIPMTLDSFTQLALRQMKTVFKDNFDLLKSEPVTVSGREGHEIVFIGKGPQGQWKYKIYWTLIGSVSYQVSFMSLESQYDKYIETVDRMFQSFHVED